MTLHDSPGGINTANNTGWAFDLTSTSTSTSSTSSSSTSSTSTSHSSTSTSTSSTSTSQSSTSISSTTTTVVPYGEKVYNSFGVNYQTSSGWATDLAYFRSIGLRIIRVSLQQLPIPWQVGNPAVFGNAQMRAAAQFFSEAGLFVTWGPSGPAGLSGNNLTATLWSEYETAIINEAVYLVSQGIVLGDFELGNELELAVDGTTLTIAELNANLRILATTIKAIPGWNMPVSYGCSGSSTAFSNWETNGLGGLDTLSIHIYGSINVSAQTVSLSNFNNIATMVGLFGDKVYVSEFNLDSSSSNILALNQTVALETMNIILNNYLLNRVSKFIIFQYYNPSATYAGFVMLQLNGNYNPAWWLFFNPTTLPWNGTTLVPRASLEISSTNANPLGSNPTALVNDTVALVNDPTALVGSQTSFIPDIRVDADDNAPNIDIQELR